MKVWYEKIELNQDSSTVKQNFWKLKLKAIGTERECDLLINRVLNSKIAKKDPNASN